MKTKMTPLTELLTTIVDNRGKTVPISDSGTPLIATNCIKHKSIYPTFDNVRYVNDEVMQSWFRAHPEPNDIIFVNKGTPGRVCLVPEPVNFCFAQDMMGFRCDSEKIDYQYLFAVLRSDFIQQKIENFHVGLVIPHFRKGDLDHIKIPRLSSRQLELAIGNLYLNISKKIELNNQANSELENMAKTLYDYWFIQFDFPDTNGKPYKSSSGKMVYNEVLKREIPEGWKQSTLWDIANYYNGLAMQKYRSTGDDYLPVIKIREMNNGISPDTEKARTDIPKAAIVDDGDLLFSWSATLDVKIWSQGKGALNQHIFKVTSDIYPQSFYYFELMNYLSHFKMMADLRKTTMGHITLEHLKQANIVLPPIELIERIDEKLKPIFEHNLVLKKENNRLVELRDWLLPMLMNGQVTVGAALAASE